MSTTKPSDEMMNFTGWFPVGWTLLWPADTAPAAFIPGQEWVVPNGENISRATYADLFSLMGTRFGNGDGSTTFRLPPKGYFLRFADTVGATGGSDTHVLTEAEMPPHTHQIFSPYIVSSFGVTTATGGGGITNTSSAGGGAAHNNMPAYQNWNLLMRIK
jgi:hypothetical protein